MNIRRYLTLVVSGAVTLALLVIAAFFLFRFHGTYRRVATELSSQLDRLDTLRNRDPFPNDENVALERDNVARTEAAFGELMTALSKDQFVAPTMEPANFPLLLQKVLGGLTAMADTNHVVVPDRFTYGFERYARNLPRGADIPRLAEQLHYVDAVCQTLFTSGLQSMLGIRRYVFEEAAGADTGEAGMEDPYARGRRSAPAPTTSEKQVATGDLGPGEFLDPQGLFARERMVFSFTTTESGVWDVLNALPRMRVFCVVSRINVQNETPPPKAEPLGEEGGTAEGARPARPGGSNLLPPGMLRESSWSRRPPGTAPGAEGEGTNLVVRIPPREDRIVAGQGDTVRVDLELDLYHFGPSTTNVTEETAP